MKQPLSFLFFIEPAQGDEFSLVYEGEVLTQGYFDEMEELAQLLVDMALVTGCTIFEAFDTWDGMVSEAIVRVLLKDSPELAAKLGLVSS